MNHALHPEDVLKLRFIRDAQISPDGHSIAYALSFTDAAGREDLYEVRVLDLTSGKEECLCRYSGGGHGHPRWSSDGHRLAYIKAGSSGHTLAIADFRDGQPREVTVSAAVISGPPAWSPNGRFIALVLGDRAAEIPVVRRIRSRHFRAEGIGFTDGVAQRICLVDVTQGMLAGSIGEPAFYSNLEWSPTGEEILFLRTAIPIPFAGESASLFAARVSDGQVREILGAGWYIVSARWTLDARHIVIVGAHKSTLTVPTTDLWVVNRDGSGATLRSAPVKGRVGYRMHHDMPIWDVPRMHGMRVSDAQCAVATVQDGGCAGIYRIALSGQTHCERIVGGDRSCIVLNSSQESGKLLYLATDLSNATDLHVWTAEEGTKQVTHVNKTVLDSWPALRVAHTNFRSADGLELEGWFLSNEAPGPHLPTVMFVHGGPFNAAGHAFRFDFHMLASHGIGIMFANFRGSFGYGEPFASAIMGDWGARGFPDHMALLDHAIERGWADERRVGVWGASHGGFATCWLVCHTQRFRAAVAEAAVTNMTTVYYLSDIPDARERDLGGKPHEIADVFRSRSPLTYAHRCTTPTLLIHGEKDLRVPIAEAEQFFRALLDVGCTTELVRLRDANHLGDSIGPPATRVAQNAALLDWFDRFL